MLPDERPDGLDSPWAARAVKLMSRSQALAFRLTRGRVGNRWRVGAGWKKPVPTLLLTHVGRKSGKEFETPLLHLDDGPDLVVVASQGGLPRNPQWYANLLAHPDTTVSLKGQWRRPVRARAASLEERALLRPRLVDLYADFANYQKWTDREFPVVVIEPR